MRKKATPFSNRIFGLLVALLLSSIAFGQHSEPIISINVTDAKVVNVLESIRKQSRMGFVYNYEQVSAQPNVTVSFQNIPLSHALKAVLENTSLAYTIENNVVQIYNKTVKPVESDPDVTEKIKNIRLTGKVENESGLPLANVSVSVFETRKGVQTKADGTYEITVPSNSRIVFSYVGMKDQAISLVKYPGNVINIRMEPEHKQLEEQVVTGFQNINRKIAVGSYTTLKPKDFMVQGVTSVDQMLQGKVAGLNIMNSSGSVNGAPTIRMRGTASFVGSGEPLWVVDGIVREETNFSSIQINQLLDASLISTKIASSISDASASIGASTIAGVNPEDIESITFLKDASATSIYGSKASNGVIVITTKKGGGKIDAPLVTFSTSFGITGRPTYDKLNRMNSKERIDVAQEIAEKGYNYEYQPPVSSYEGALLRLFSKQITEDEFQRIAQQAQTINTDWLKLLFQNSFSQNYTLSVAGGNNKSGYYASLNYVDEKGSTIGDGAKIYGANIRINTELTKKLRLDFKLGGSIRKSDGFFTTNPYDYAYNTSRAISSDDYYPLLAATTDYNTDPTLLASPYTYNFLNERAQTANNSQTKNMNAMLEVKYKIIKGLEFGTLFGYNSVNLESKQWATDKSYYVARIRGYNYTTTPDTALFNVSSLPYGGILSLKTNSAQTISMRNTLNFDRAFFDGDHTLNILAGMEVSSNRPELFSTTEYGYYPDQGNRIANDYGRAGQGITNSLGKHMVNMSEMISNSLSWFLVGSYSIKNKYAFNVSVRTDASNRFGQNSKNKFLPIYSFGGKWNISEENFLSDVKFLNNLSLRASYGIQGNVVKSVGPDLVVTYGSEPIDKLTGDYILKFVSPAYPDLRWEKSATTNVGLDMSFFNNRLNASVDYYYKKGSDLLFAATTPSETGMSALYYNGGTLVNTGLEFMLSVTPIRTKMFEWTFSINGAQNKNKSTSQQTSPKTGNSLINDYLSGTVVTNGKPVNGFYSYKFAGINGNNGMPVFDIPANANYYDPTTWLVYSGKLIPDFTGGIQTSFRYQRITLSASFNYVTGNKKRLNPLYNASKVVYAPQPDRNLSAELVNRWRNPGDELHTNIPVLTINNTTAQYDTLPAPPTANANVITEGLFKMYDKSDLRTVNGSYLRCTNIALSYSLPPVLLKKITCQSASVTFAVRNVFKIADKKLHGQDPETAGFGGTSLPVLPVFNFGFKCNF